MRGLYLWTILSRALFWKRQLPNRDKKILFLILLGMVEFICSSSSTVKSFEILNVQSISSLNRSFSCIPEEKALQVALGNINVNTGDVIASFDPDVFKVFQLLSNFFLSKLIFFRITYSQSCHKMVGLLWVTLFGIDISAHCTVSLPAKNLFLIIYLLFRFIFIVFILNAPGYKLFFFIWTGNEKQVRIGSQFPQVNLDVPCIEIWWFSHDRILHP